jgi:hypothetical protein
MRGEHVELVPTREERAREEHLGQHDPDREQVTPSVELLPITCSGDMYPILPLSSPG